MVALTSFQVLREFDPDIYLAGGAPLLQLQIGRVDVPGILTALSIQEVEGNHGVAVAEGCFGLEIPFFLFGIALEKSIDFEFFPTDFIEHTVMKSRALITANRLCLFLPNIDDKRAVRLRLNTHEQRLRRRQKVLVGVFVPA